MKLNILKPPRLQTARSVLPMLETKAGTTPRPRGRAWMETRERVALLHSQRCVDCGRVWMPHVDQLDHDVPLEQGGSNEDSNLRPRCIDCHAAKTKREAGARATRPW